MTFLKGLFRKKVEEVKKKILPDVVICNVDPNELWKIESELGDGGYGKVYKVTKCGTSLQAALKTVKFESEAELDDFIVEIEILMGPKHPNVLSLHEVYIFDKSLWLFLELCSGGALDSIMNSLEKPLSEPQIQFVAHETLEGLKFLHENLIIHRDLKAGNILITSSAEVKLADFGASAKLLNERQKRDTFIGTPYWMAPEVVTCEAFKATPYNWLADVWSFGITLLELAQMRPPNDNINPTRVLLTIAKADPPSLSRPKLWSKEFKEIISRCLKKDPLQRPECSELLKDPFVRDVCENDRKNIRLLLGELKADVEDVVEDIGIDSPEFSDDIANVTAPLDDVLEEEAYYDEDEDEGLVADVSGEDSIGDGSVAAISDIPVPLSSLLDDHVFDAVLHELIGDILDRVILSEAHQPSVPACVFEVMRDLSQDNIESGADSNHLSTAVTSPSDNNEKGNREQTVTIPVLVPAGSFDDHVPTSPPNTSTVPAATDAARQPNSGARPRIDKPNVHQKTEYRTITRTRRFVIDGKEVVTVTRRRVPAAPSNSTTRTRAPNDFNKRKAELRALRLISKQEVSQIRELTARASQLKEQLESRLSAEAMTFQRNYEQKMELAYRTCRADTEKLEKDHEAEIKRSRLDMTKKEQLFKEHLKSEINAISNRSERKAALRELRKDDQSTFLFGVPSWSSGSSLVSLNSTTSVRSSVLSTTASSLISRRLSAFRKEEALRLHDKIRELTRVFTTRCADLRRRELMEKQTIRMDFEQEKWRMEQRHMNVRYQLDRTRMQDFFVIKRHKLARILDLDLLELRQTTIDEREELTLRHALERKRMAKYAKVTTKQALVDFQRSCRGTIPAFQFKEQLHEIEERTRQYLNSESEHLEARLAGEAQCLEQSILARSSELEQSHARRRNELIQCETERLQESDQCHENDIKMHKEAVPRTLMLLREQFTQELLDFSQNGSPRETLQHRFSSDHSKLQSRLLKPNGWSSSLINLHEANKC